MRVLAVLNQKGGSSKTTIATNLAVAFQRDGYRVAIIDADPQGTASEWGARQEDTPPVFGADRPTLHRDLPELADSFDIAIIDGAPTLEDMAISAVKAADLVLVPIRASAADIWSADDMIDIVRARQKVTGAPHVAFVVTQQVAQSNLAGDVERALEGRDVPIMSARLNHRVAYAEALGAGASVLDTTNQKARREIESLATETLTKLENANHARG